MLEDLDHIVTANPSLTLPIGGRKYVVPECTGETWMRLARHGDALREHADALAKAVADGDTDVAKIETAGLIDDLDLCRLALGPAYDEMLPHVPPSKLKVAGFTAWLWQVGNTAGAEAYWASGGKAPSRSRSTSTSTAAASGTRRRASGSGTTSRRRSPAKSKPSAKAT